MATDNTSTPSEMTLIDEYNVGVDGEVSFSRIEHIGGEVDFFISARDFVGEGPDLKISVETAEAFHAWLGKQLGK